MSSRGGKSPSYIASPRKSTNMYDDSDDDLAKKHGKGKDDSFVLLGTAVDVHGAPLTPSAPPLLAEMDASAPPMLESPPHTAVVFVQPAPTAGSGGVNEAGVPMAAPLQKPANIRTGQWEIGICCCHKACMPTCVMTTFCPCITMAQVAGRMGLVSHWYALLFFVGVYLAETLLGTFSIIEVPLNAAASDGSNAADAGSSFFTERAFQIGLVFGALNMLATWQLRIKIRERFDIPGNACVDCCAACCMGFFCCTCCVVSQMAAHVKVYKPGKFDFGPVDVLPAYECAPHQSVV